MALRNSTTVNNGSVSCHCYEQAGQQQFLLLALTIMVRIRQAFSRTFSVFFSRFCEFECNTTFDWLNRMLHSNAAIDKKKIWRTRQRTLLRMGGETGPELLLHLVLILYQTNNIVEIENILRRQLKCNSNH